MQVAGMVIFMADTGIVIMVVLKVVTVVGTVAVADLAALMVQDNRASVTGLHHIPVV